MQLARQHIAGVDDYRLVTLCGRLGVAYTDGHRAEHDARAAADVFFALREHIADRWRTDAAFGRIQIPADHWLCQ